MCETYQYINFLNYSYATPAVTILLLGLFVLFSGFKNISNRIYFLSILGFLFWMISDYLSFSSNNPMQILWIERIATLGILGPIFVSMFIYVFPENRPLNKRVMMILLLPLVPFIALLPTKYVVQSISSPPTCDTETGIFYWYLMALILYCMVFIAVVSIKKFKTLKENFKKQLNIFILGISIFLVVVSFLTIIATIYKQYSLVILAPFSVIIYTGFCAYSIVKYQSFNIKLVTSQVLVVATWIIIGAQFLFIKTHINFILTGITLALTVIFGIMLIRSVKIEAKQKEELEKANAELKKLDQSKTEFMNIASHQLRTPITVIKGTIDLLRKGEMESFEPEEKQHFYESAWTKCHKLEDIVNDILSASTLSNRKFIISDKNSRLINLNEMLDRNIHDFDAEIKERDIELTFTPYQQEKPEIFGIQEYLSEVFDNLINNAIKYTPSKNKNYEIRSIRENGKAKVNVSIAKDKDNFVVEIKDNGIGISKEEIPKLFRKFVRAENAVNMYTDGSGLGLYVVKEIVEGHGGKVWVESELEKGSTFFVSLPIKPAKEIDVKGYFLREDSNQTG